jgi:hypothetical protein
MRHAPATVAYFLRTLRPAAARTTPVFSGKACRRSRRPELSRRRITIAAELKSQGGPFPRLTRAERRFLLD